MQLGILHFTNRSEATHYTSQQASCHKPIHNSTSQHSQHPAFQWRQGNVRVSQTRGSMRIRSWAGKLRELAKSERERERERARARARARARPRRPQPQPQRRPQPQPQPQPPTPYPYPYPYHYHYPLPLPQQQTTTPPPPATSTATATAIRLWEVEVCLRVCQHMRESESPMRAPVAQGLRRCPRGLRREPLEATVAIRCNSLHFGFPEPRDGEPVVRSIFPINRRVS